MKEQKVNWSRKVTLDYEGDLEFSMRSFKEQDNPSNERRYIGQLYGESNDVENLKARLLPIRDSLQ